MPAALSTRRAKKRGFGIMDQNFRESGGKVLFRRGPCQGRVAIGPAGGVAGPHTFAFVESFKRVGPIGVVVSLPHSRPRGAGRGSEPPGLPPRRGDVEDPEIFQSGLRILGRWKLGWLPPPAVRPPMDAGNRILIPLGFGVGGQIFPRIAKSEAGIGSDIDKKHFLMLSGYGCPPQSGGPTRGASYNFRVKLGIFEKKMFRERLGLNLIFGTAKVAGKCGVFNPQAGIAWFRGRIPKVAFTPGS